MGKRVKKMSTREAAQGGGGGHGLEVVSVENFQKRLEGLSSGCEQCTKKRSQEGGSSSRSGGGREKKRRGQVKSKEPIVIRLSDSLRLSASRQRKHKASMLSETDSSPVSDDDTSSLKSDDSDSQHSIKAKMASYLKSKDGKNFNAFLSAIEKVHKKIDRTTLSANLDNTSLQTALDKFSSLVLNNRLSRQEEDQERSSKRRGYSNIELICNDLSSHATTDWSSEESSENSSVISSSEWQSDSEVSVTPPELASSSRGGSCSSSCSSGGQLTQEELEKLTYFTSGFPLFKVDALQHYYNDSSDWGCCPECLAAYYGYYYAQGMDLYKTEEPVISNVEVLPPTSPVSKNHRVEVHVVLDSDSDTEDECSTVKRKKRHYGGHTTTTREVKTAVVSTAVVPSTAVNSVYLDLTETDVSVSIYYHTDSSQEWPQSQSQCQGSGEWCYDFYTGYGYMPYTVPYMYMPSTYYCPAPCVTIPRPLCVPRDLECLHSSRLCMVPAHEIKDFTASQPPQRPWIPLAHPERNRPTALFTVMCYNVLCDKYCTRQLYGYCPSWGLNWEYRKKGIIEEIRHYNADIISLQEVETDQFYNFFKPELVRDGYDGIFSPKSRARTMSESDRKHVDGCAIFFKTSKFSLIKETLIEFNQLAMANAEGSDHMLNRVMTKDNIGLTALLETKAGVYENGLPPENQIHQPILVATAHIHWDPEFCDVKLIQTMMLMNELKNIIEDQGTSFRPGSSQVPDVNSIPLIMCGDLNSLPDSGVVDYLLNGKVPSNHEDFKDLGYHTSLQKLGNCDVKDLYSHPFRIDRAYSSDIMPYTNYTFDFKGIIDYIFFSRDSMTPLGLLGPLDKDWFLENKVLGCPHPHIPSDHFSLLAELEMQVPPTTQPASSQASSSTSSGSSSTTTTSSRGNNIHSLSSRR